MGSFANSLHVRTEDLAAVARAVQDLLRAEGFEPTDEPLDPDARWGMSATLRGIHISQPRQGWVAILENDPLSSISLAAELSRSLDTFAIHFFVNDSDSWHYQLFRAGEQIDAFDSQEDEESWDEDEEAAAAALLAGGGLAELQAAMRGKAQDLEKLLTAGMPDDVRQLHAKMQSGKAAPEEIQQYLAWISAEMPKRMGDMQRLIGEALQGIGGGNKASAASGSSGSPSEQEDRRLLPHVEQLQALLVPGTPVDQILELLGRQAVFAEETLGEFLPLVGIAPVYAHLSYRYLEEFAESELASQSVRMAEHLRFRSAFEEDE